jgi:hypothetical protein
MTRSFPDSALAVLVAALAALCCARSPAQDRDPSSLRLDGVDPRGVRRYATESWGTFGFTLTNHGDSGRLARVVLNYAGYPEEYARDVFVPARSRIESELLVGPTPRQKADTQREIEVRLYDRTDGDDRLIPPPTEERIRSRGVSYRKHEPGSTIMVEEDDQPRLPGQLPRPDSPADEATRLVLTLRHRQNLSPVVSRTTPGAVLGSADAFAGTDHFVVACSGIADNPAGMRGLRRWLVRGGKVWVMLDLVENPLDPIRVEIPDKEMLQLDEDGGLHVKLFVSDPLTERKTGGHEGWKINYLEVEIVGRSE